MEMGPFLLAGLAKTVIFRTLATIMDLTPNYVVVGNAVQAVILSATGLAFGPFIYFGHGISAMRKPGNIRLPQVPGRR